MTIARTIPIAALSRDEQQGERIYATRVYEIPANATIEQAGLGLGSMLPDDARYEITEANGIEQKAAAGMSPSRRIQVRAFRFVEWS